MNIEEIKKEIQEEIDYAIVTSVIDETIFDDLSKSNYLEDVEDEIDLADFFDTTLYNLDKLINDLQELEKKLTKLYNKYI